MVMRRVYFYLSKEKNSLSVNISEVESDRNP